MRSAIARLRWLLTFTRTVLHAFGVTGILRRVVYELGLRSGAIARRLPVRDGYDHFAPLVWRHRFDLPTIHAGYARLPDADGLRARLEEDVSRVIGGTQRLYGWMDVEVGWPPRWAVDPSSGVAWPDEHWTRIPDDAPEIGDIKDVWELSRLPATFLLARAYASSSDERHAETWWVLLEDWLVQNPPNRGANWRCGQETSLRGIAVCFGLSAFAGAAASTPERMEAAGRLLAASIERVRPTVGYALSQRNNHAVSELVFLLSTVGPAPRWCRRLAEVLKDQWYPDGSYAQQSANYQRLAVQALQWLLTVRCDIPAELVRPIEDVLGRSAYFLQRTSDPVSGTLSNMGANDGAHLLPLSASKHHDARPLLASLGVATDSAAAAEQALWISTPVDVPDLTRVSTAWPSVTVGTVHAVMHAGPSRHRAGHADQLAIEVHRDGKPVLVDPGTYRYSGERPWRNPFTGPETHSALTLVEERPSKFGRFLAAPQAPAEVVQHTSAAAANAISVLICRRTTASSAVLWRTLIVGPEGLHLLDAVEGGRAVIRHLMAVLEDPPSFEVIIGVDGGKEMPVVGRTEQIPTSGWWSPEYANRHPCTVVEIELDSAGGGLLTMGGRSGTERALDSISEALPAPVVQSWRSLIDSSR
jgi:hypothetical protein